MNLYEQFIERQKLSPLNTCEGCGEFNPWETFRMGVCSLRCAVRTINAANNGGRDD